MFIGLSREVVKDGFSTLLCTVIVEVFVFHSCSFFLFFFTKEYLIGIC